MVRVGATFPNLFVFFTRCSSCLTIQSYAGLNQLSIALSASICSSLHLNTPDSSARAQVSFGWIVHSRIFSTPKESSSFCQVIKFLRLLIVDITSSFSFVPSVPLACATGSLTSFKIFNHRRRVLKLLDTRQSCFFLNLRYCFYKFFGYFFFTTT